MDPTHHPRTNSDAAAAIAYYRAIRIDLQQFIAKMKADATNQQ